MRLLKIFMLFLLTITQVACSFGNGNSLSSGVAYERERKFVNPAMYGAKGDGITDDTISLQNAFKICSENGLTCRLPKGKKYLITSPLYLWGDANLEGEGGSGNIVFNVPDIPYLLNIGISGPNQLEASFTGVISGVTFNVIGGNSGRIIFFWRTEGAKIINNTFDVGRFAYSATSSGNNNEWVVNGFKNCVRKNIIIKGNIIRATGSDYGSEGIGLGHFDGALIEENEITGVGDDPIGIHFSKNIKIFNNKIRSVDGRIYVSNSRDVEIAYNNHERMPSMQNNKFYKGISLIYIGLEFEKDNGLSAPTNIYVYHNNLYYPEGAIDSGSAIYLYGPRDTVVEFNQVRNDSSLVTATALHLLPLRFPVEWHDPDFLDPSNVARVWDADIFDNTSVGTHPLKMIMTDNCDKYKGHVAVKNNLAAGYQFYCSNVTFTGNRETSR